MRKISLILCMVLGMCLMAGGADATAKRPAMTKEKAVAGLHFSFLLPEEEIGKYFDEGIAYKELKELCLHAYIAKRPLAEVVDLRKKYTWTRAKALLGLTPQKIYDGTLAYKADRLYRLAGIDKKTSIKYMKMGYASHQVKRAYFISTHCDKPLLEILEMKTRQLKWGDVAEKLGLPREACMK